MQAGLVIFAPHETHGPAILGDWIISIRKSNHFDGEAQPETAIFWFNVSKYWFV